MKIESTACMSIDFHKLDEIILKINLDDIFKQREKIINDGDFVSEIIIRVINSKIAFYGISAKFKYQDD